MTFDELLASMTPEVHATMKQVVEIGKWPDGRRLTSEERETCLRAVMAYDAMNLPEEERVGYVDSSAKTEPCGSSSSADHAQSEAITIKPIIH